MNLPVKIKNKQPWLSISSFASLLIDKINFDGLNINCLSDETPDGYFGRKHIPEIITAIQTSNTLLFKIGSTSRLSFYEDTLEVYFYNLEMAIDKLLDYLYLTNPVNVENEVALDVTLENALNKISPNSTALWKDQLIKGSLSGILSDSFLDYEIAYDNRTKTSQCRVLFRYLPESTERTVILDLKLNPNLIPETLKPRKYKLNELDPIMVTHIKDEVKESWGEKFGWNEPNYQRSLYESIMADLGGLTLDDYYVKSFLTSKYNRVIDTRELESNPQFNLLTPEFLASHSSNIVSCIIENNFNYTTINPGFEYGIQGWNRVSKLANLTGHVLTTSQVAPSLVISDEITNTTEDNSELQLNQGQVSFTQENRLPEGNYELQIAIKTSIARDFTLTLGSITQMFTLPADPVNPKVITLTDTQLGGIEITNAEFPSGIVTYGFSAGEVIITQPELEYTYIEYCRIKKI